MYGYYVPILSQDYFVTLDQYHNAITYYEYMYEL